MQCPICQKEYEKNQTIYVCDRCGYVFDSWWKDECFPTCDLRNRKVKEIVPDHNLLAQKMNQIIDMCDEYEEIKPIPTKRQAAMASLPTICSIVFSLIISLFTNFLVGFIVLVPMLIATAVWMTMYVNDILKPQKTKIAKIPIRYYENEHVFGITQIALQNGRMCQPPKYKFLEIDKKDVIAVTYNQNKGMYAIHIHPNNEFVQDVIYIPDVFEPGFLNTALSK